MRLALNIFLFFLITISSSFAQDHYETTIISKNDYEISIIQVFPDSFPKVTVVFQAKNELGDPLWLLDISDLYVKENWFKCQTIAVRNISEKRPINVGLVFDHSASMVENPDQMEEGVESYQQLYFADKLPKGYVMSIDYAKEAVLQFFAQDKVDTDSMFFIGFSKEVDKIPPLTNNLNDFTRIVSKIRPSGNTAFYDAVYNGIDSLSAHQSSPVVIALTDGQDNSSIHTGEEVIEHAQLHDVPVYIIGLGDVHESGLKRICSETDGFYYHTNDPSKLVEIYFNIKKQVRSIYELDYLSSLDYSQEPNRNIRFFFTNDTLTFSAEREYFDLPSEVIDRINGRHFQMKEEKEQKIRDDNDAKFLNYSLGIGVGLLGIAGFVVYRRRKKKTQIILDKIYPNPFRDKVTLAFKSNSTELELWVTDASGLQVHKENFLGQTSPVELNLSQLESGVYLFTLKDASAQSNTLKAVKK